MVRRDEIPSYGALARRLRSRTVDLLAVALVAMITLTFGREIVQWWRPSPPLSPVTSPAAGEPVWGAEGMPVALEFGDRPIVLTRVVVRGLFEEARDQLVTRLREVMATAQPMSPQPESAEREFLALGQKLKPFEEQSGEWSLYAPGDRFSLMFGLRQFSSASEGEALSAREPRLVCWGMIVGSPETHWTVLAFHNRGLGSPVDVAGQVVASHEGSNDNTEVPLPRGGRRIMSVSDRSGSRVQAFSASRSLLECRQHFDAWAVTADWKREGEWSVSGAACVARFVRGVIRPATAAAKTATRETIILDVQLESETAAACRGVLLEMRQESTAK